MRCTRDLKKNSKYCADKLNRALTESIAAQFSDDRRSHFNPLSKYAKYFNSFFNKDMVCHSFKGLI